MSLFTKMNKVLLKRAGEEWTTTVEGECLTFNAIMDDEEALENDNAGKVVVVRRNVLTVSSLVAKHFDFKQKVTKDEKEYYVMETLRESDGSLTRCVIVEVE